VSCCLLTADDDDGSTKGLPVQVAETKKTAHLKNMRRRYIVLYVLQMPPASTEGRLPQTGHPVVDELRQHWPEVSDVSMMLNSPWPEGCERSDGCAWP
jgi:hypothetical protein